jgi:hypothetical protein
MSFVNNAAAVGAGVAWPPMAASRAEGTRRPAKAAVGTEGDMSKGRGVAGATTEKTGGA